MDAGHRRRLSPRGTSAEERDPRVDARSVASMTSAGASVVDPAGDAALGTRFAACANFASVSRVKDRQIERSPEVIR